MGADTTEAKIVEAPPLTPLNIKTRLAPTPKGAPKFSTTIKNSAGEEVVLADPRATRALVALMDIHAVVGGAACHWGGPAAFAEINAAIHGLMFSEQGRDWSDAYNFVNDAGHTENGIYALRANYGFDGLTLDSLRGFRGIDSKLTGHGESHLNPEGVLLSNGPLSSSISQAQGLAIADKLAKRDRVTVITVSDGAAMEGEAKEAFAAIPGLAAKDRVNPFVLILSDNNTKLSGRITDDAFDMTPTFKAMETLGWNVTKVENGHDLEDVYQTFEKAVADAKANPKQPVCLWIKTIKGYGIQSTAENSAGGHGFPLKNGEKAVDWVKEIYSNDVPAEIMDWAKELRQQFEAAEEAKKTAAGSSAPKPPTNKVQAGLASGAVKAAQEGIPVFSISSDVQGSTGISAFQKSFQGRDLEVGVAEANMISSGAGLSKGGYVAIVDTFGQFGVTKGNLPLTMAALSQAPVIAVFSHVGFQDAADGASHQATTYLAAVSAIPHTVVIAPSCSNEAEALMLEACRKQSKDRLDGKDGETYIFFVGRENYPLEWIDGATYPWGKAQVTQDGSDVVIAGSGTLFGYAVEAGKRLAEEGISAAVVNNPFINRPDVETFGPLVQRASGKLITIEDHQAVCGMGAQLSHALSRAGFTHRVESLGIEDEFGQSAYKAAHLYEKHGMNADAIVKRAKSLLKA